MNQDVFIVICGAILGTVSLMAGFTWEIRRWRRPTTASPVVQQRPVDARSAEDLPTVRRGPLRALWDVIDASIGMYLFRRLPGRPKVPRSRKPQGPLDDPGEDVANRIDAATPGAVAVTRPTRIVVAGAAVSASTAVTGPTVGANVRSAPPGPDRRQFYRDTSVAVAGLAAVLLLAAVVLPSFGSGDGQVLGETGTPERSVDGVIAATQSPIPSDGTVVYTPSDAPSPSLEPAVTATPKPTPKPSPKPTRRPVVATHPTAAPTPKPTPTLDTSTPSLNPSPTPNPPTPTPNPPTPTPDPSTPTAPPTP